MTYVPVDNPQGGRTPKPIHPKLLQLLRHSAETGKRIEIPVTADDDPASVAELRRALTRAGYTQFRDKTINKRFTPTLITFWVTKKRGKGKTK